jgi:adenosylcobinamide-phosphate synthase
MYITIGIAMLLDLLIGDPPNWPHPIRFFGWIIANIEKWIRKGIKNLYIGGFLLLMGSIVGALLPVLLMKAIIPPFLFTFIEIYLLYTFLASRCLTDEAMKVKKALDSGDLESARFKLSYLVGRDTKSLSQSDVTRGVVETVAENTIDGVLAPLFYMIIGIPFGLSLELALIYKVVNTLDSMVGYIQPPYKEIGFASAKMDDFMNFIPARIGAFIMILTGAFIGKDVKNGFKIFIRDRNNHKSPNSGHPESAIAGLLGIQIGGSNVYFGNLVVKPTIGDANKPIESKHISETIKVMIGAELLAYSLCWLPIAILK